MGTTIYAQNALIWQIYVLGLYIVEGIGYSTETLVGSFKSQGLTKELASTLKMSLTSALLVGFSLALVSVLFPHTVFGLFTNKEASGQEILIQKLEPVSVMNEVTDMPGK